MYKLVIADDEPIIRKSIANFIEWNKLGFELVGVFCDGSEVIEYIKENDVDVVLSDIIMSNLGGLDIAKFIYEQKLPIKIIFLSAYQNFEFAHQGIKFGISDYLLKPISMNEIATKFMNVKKILDEEKGLMLEEKVQQELISDIHASYIKKIWFAEDIKSEEISIYENIINIQKTNQKKRIVFMCKNMRKSEFLEERLISVRNKLEEKGYYSCYIGDGRALILFAINNSDNVEILIRKAIAIISCEEMATFCVNVKQYTDFDECNLPDEEVEKLNKAIKESIGYLDKLDKAQMCEREGLESSISALPEVQRQAVMNVSVEIFLSITRLNTTKAKEMQKILNEMIFEENSASLYLNKVYGQFLKVHNAGIGAEYDYAIEKVKHYIKEHISEDLSLNQLASIVNLNPVYFGRYFKKATLISVKQFIYETKMEEAIEMLSQKRYTLNEISQMIGCDFKYFFMLFKKYTGYTPREYLKYFIE